MAQGYYRKNDNKMIGNIIIREATYKDIPEIAELYRTDLNLSINQDVWEWEYFKRPGYQTFYVVAVNNGRIIGSQALIPVKMMGNKRVILSAKSESTLVCKQFRGQGIFEKMYSKLFQIAEQRGIKVIWGFTGAKKAFLQIGFTVPISLNLGCIPLDVDKNFKYFIGKLKLYHNKLSYFASLPLMIYLLLKRFRLLLCLIYYDMKYRSSAQYVCELLKVDKEFDKLLSIINENNKKNGIITIYRDIDYINWRIITNPSIAYKILTYEENMTKGYIIFYIREGILVITDYGCTNVDTVFPVLLNRVLHLGFAEKCWCVHFLDKESLENRKYRKYFKNYSSIIFKNSIPMVLKIIDNELFDMEKDVENWFITEMFSQGI